MKSKLLFLLPLLLVSCSQTNSVIVKKPEIYNNVEIVRHEYTYELNKGEKNWNIPFNYIAISKFNKSVREYELNINNTLFDYLNVGHTNGVPYVLYIYE